MDEYTANNILELRGRLSGRPELSHISRGLRFWRFPLTVRRLSGAEDTVNVIVPEALMAEPVPEEDAPLRVDGELRSFNNRGGEGSRLVISAYARSLRFEEGDEHNLVRLRGSLCRAPVLRVTPLGRDICDLMLAVNRRSGRSDYLPCIAWGLRAREAETWAVGDRVELTGRIQSRNYIKLTENGAETRVAFEVSVSEIALV